MSRFALLALLVAACDVAPADTLPAEAAPVPQFLQLEATPAVLPGETVLFRIQGAQPGARVRLIGSDGDIGPGACPPALAGACADITAGNSGYITLANLRVNGAGSAIFGAPLPRGVRPGQWVFQAIDVAAATGSNPVTVGLLCALPPATPNPTFIDCTQPSACQGQTLTCPDGEDCLIHCGGISSCQVADIQCPNGGRCDIVCDNTSACQIMEVFGGDGDLSVECSGISACQIGEVTCGTGNCYTTCDRAQGASLAVIDVGPATCSAVDDDCL